MYNQFWKARNINPAIWAGQYYHDTVIQDNHNRESFEYHVTGNTYHQYHDYW